MKIMIAEDEIEMSNVLVKILRHNRYSVDAVYDGETAVKYAEAGTYDAIVVDIMMPKLDGLQVVKTLRAHGCDTPVMILTAKSELEDKVEGLDSGADDYMTKPFNILEVKSRIKAIFRRTAMMQKESTQSILTVRDMRINLNNRSVTIGQKEINLTAKEFDLLQLFVSNRGKVFSRENLLETIWKYDYLGDLRTVDVHIRRLREKIEKNPAQPEFIFTKWGVGYYFTDKD